MTTDPGHAVTSNTLPVSAGMTDAITDILDSEADADGRIPIEVAEALHRAIASYHPYDHPVAHVQWVPIDKIRPNDYNPNSVAHKEMSLLYRSIDKDGYTQPTVTVYDPEEDIYVIVDGFHRYHVMKSHEEIAERSDGRLPVVVMEKSRSERMASTVRHNRARGKHATSGMASMVFHMLEQVVPDAEICNELGLEPEELVRLKHVTGFSALFKDHDYEQEWVTEKQVELKREYAEDE